MEETKGPGTMKSSKPCSAFAIRLANVSSLLVVGVSSQIFACKFANGGGVEATPQMPKLSLLVMLDGEANDSKLMIFVLQADNASSGSG
jgi:hypothetical protein